MSSIRFDKIGSVIKNPDGKYTVGPIPNIGGPFDTAADFFQHWSNQLQFPTDETGVRKLMGHRPDLFDSVWGFHQRLPFTAFRSRATSLFSERTLSHLSH
jgi:hypothetical protein